MKRFARILCSLMLVMSMGVGITSSSFATTTTTIETLEGNVTITPLNNTTYLMSDGDSVATMSLTKVDKDVRITIKEDGVENYFYVDTSANTIYSSITGEVIALDEPTLSNVSTKAIGDKVSSKTYKVTYKQIANAVGTTASLYSYAGMIVAVIAASQGIVVVTATAFIMSTLKGALLDRFLAGVKAKSGSHGVKIIVGTYRYSKHQGGAIVHGYTYKIDSVSLY